MSINITVSDADVGDLSVSQVSDTQADVSVTAASQITLTVEGGIGSPGAGNVTLAAGSGITISTVGTTATIATTSSAVSSSNLTELNDVSAASPTVGQVLTWGGSSWEASAGSTLTLATTTPAALGTAAVGTDTAAARADHVHKLPTFQTITNGTATTDSDLTLDPHTGVVIVAGGNAGSGAITLNCENNSHGVTIQGPPHSDAASYTLTLPSTAGTQGQVLQTSGASGALSWTSAAGGGVAWSDVPTASDSAGDAGDIAYDNNFFYLRNSLGWRRVALSGWGVAITISEQPNSVVSSVGQQVTFSVTASTTGGGAVTYQWQQATFDSEFVSLTGETNSSLTITVTSGTPNNQYRCLLNAAGATEVTSDAASVSFSSLAQGNQLLIESGDHLHAENGNGLLSDGVAQTVTFTTHPVDTELVGGEATLTCAVTGTGTGAISLQWQRRVSSQNSWFDLIGETGTDYIIDGTDSRDQSGAQYRVIATQPGSAEVISNIATITVPFTSIDTVIYPDSDLDGSTPGHEAHLELLGYRRVALSGNGRTVAATIGGYNTDYAADVDDTTLPGINVYKQVGQSFSSYKGTAPTATARGMLSTGYITVGSGVGQFTLENPGSREPLIAISKDGTTIAAAMKDAAPYNPDNTTDQTYEPYNSNENWVLRGLVRVWKYDSSTETWSQAGSDIYGDNYTQGYGGYYQRSQFASDIAMSDDGNRIFVADGVSTGYGIESEVSIFDYDETYGWERNAQVKLPATGGGGYHATGDGHSIASLECNGAGTLFGFRYQKTADTSLVGRNSYPEPDYADWNYPHYFVVYKRNTSTSWAQTGDTLTWGGKGFSIQAVWSRDMQNVVISETNYDRGQVTRVGRVERYRISGSYPTLGSWSQRGETHYGTVSNGGLSIRAVNEDATRILATGFAGGTYGHTLARYRAGATSLSVLQNYTRPNNMANWSRTSTARGAGVADMNDEGTRIAVNWPAFGDNAENVGIQIKE